VPGALCGAGGGGDAGGCVVFRIETSA
jgi:hypothetical protein